MSLASAFSQSNSELDCSHGLFVTGKCRPMFNTILGSRDMVFSLIRNNFKYVDETGADQAAVIPTLHEWMDAFAANTALKLIILDMKIVNIDLADYLVEHIMIKATTLGVQDKIRIVSSDYSMAAAFQTSLARLTNPASTATPQESFNINIVSRSFLISEINVIQENHTLVSLIAVQYGISREVGIFIESK